MPRQANTRADYLGSYSKKDKPWDKHKRHGGVVASLYSKAQLLRLAAAMALCAQVLFFKWKTCVATGESHLRLFKAFLCRARHCPICQWRRVKFLQHRLLGVLPKIETEHPKARCIFLTVTVRNCPLTELRQQLKLMNLGWQRLIKIKNYPKLGFIRSTEVTRGKDGSAHPHFHVLIMVKPSYFSKYYLSQQDWTDMWRKAMRLDYQPIVDVRRVRMKGGRSALPELVKYAVKASDLMHDKDWLVELTKQLKGLRFHATGGILKQAISAHEPTNEELVTLDNALLNDDELGELIKFMWRKDLKRYCKTATLK